MGEVGDQVEGYCSRPAKAVAGMERSRWVAKRDHAYSINRLLGDLRIMSWMWLESMGGLIGLQQGMELGD